MELEKREVRLNYQKGKAVSQFTLEEDFNVPDQKADIFRIIHKQGEFQLDEIKAEDGKAKIRGRFLYRVLYIGEGMEHMPEYLEGSIPVDELVFLNELQEGDNLDFHWDLEDLYASAIHSRKANIKCILVFQIEAFREQSVVLLEQAEEAEDTIFWKYCPLRLQQEVIHRKDILRVKEEINLPAGKENMKRILWKEIRLQGTQLRQEEGKLFVKGELVVFFLYESEESGKISWLEQNLPFYQELECEACHSDLFGKAEVYLQRAEMELQADYDGEARMVRVDVVLELLLRYFEDSTHEVLCDAYSLSKQIELKEGNCVWDFVKNVSDSRARVSGRMKLAEQDMKPLQLLTTGAQLHLEHSEKTDRGLLLQGNMELWVLYTTTDDAQPLACVQHSFPFEHTAEMPQLDENSAWQIFLAIDQLTVSMLDAQELEMKAILQAQILAWNTQELRFMEEIEEKPLNMEMMKKMPGILIHMVQPEETLWDIAKNHFTSCEAILNLNEMKEENIKAGQKLLLVKELQPLAN